MPLTFQTGVTYRTFSTPNVYQCDERGQIDEMELPVDKAYMFVGDPEGSVFEIWRFNIESSDSPSSTVIKPINPLFDDFGRWKKMPISGGGGGAGFLSGNGSPEGVVTGEEQGQTYLDLDTGGLWAFAGTPGTNTGWV